MSASDGARLRQDLRLYPGPRRDGAPSWMLYDPVRHAYYQIDPGALAVMQAWTGTADAERLAIELEESGPLLASGTVEAFLEFAQRNELVEGGELAWRGHARRKQAARPSALMWVVHNYLFIKLPLWRPRRAFEHASFVAAPFFTRAFVVLTMGAALATAYLVSRQWTAFASTFAGFLSLDGALVYALTLVGTKTIHELAHAFTAARHGCRISSMGIALMVGVPMLYCDVTDSWRLPRRRDRMAIDAAGLLAEACLAVYAGLAWALLPEGPLRTGAFLVASASLVSSVIVNLNPMMRFDGYLILSDALGVPNLQSRAFALMRWQWREWLFSIGAPRPDAFRPAKHATVLAYAASVIVYRAIVYSGIALLVYHATFKLLGIALFAIEVGWFLVAPVWKELSMWWHLKRNIGMSERARVTGFAVLLIVGLLVFPFHTTVVVPAVLEPTSYARVFPTSPAMVRSVAVHRGETVAAGQELATLVSPQIARDQELARIRLALVEAKLRRGVAVAEERAETLSLAMERGMLRERLDALERERRELVLKSPIAGVVRELDPDLDPGRWLGRDAQVALVVASAGSTVRGYVRDGSTAGLDIGTIGTFEPDSWFLRAAPVRLVDIGWAAVARLDIPSLSSLQGGPIAARLTPEHGASPDYAVFPARFDAGIDAPATTVRGTVVLTGARASLAGGVVRQVARVLVREAGL